MTNGRINRRTFVFTSLILLAIPNLLLVIGAIYDISPTPIFRFIQVISGILVLASVVYMIPTLILLILRRAHDFNSSGYIWLLTLGIPFTIILPAIIPGSKQENQFGPKPPKRAELRKAFIWWQSPI